MQTYNMLFAKINCNYWLKLTIIDNPSTMVLLLMHETTHNRKSTISFNIKYIIETHNKYITNFVKILTKNFNVFICKCQNSCIQMPKEFCPVMSYVNRLDIFYVKIDTQNVWDHVLYVMPLYILLIIPSLGVNLSVRGFSFI